jgi:hypothetical protein
LLLNAGFFLEALFGEPILKVDLRKETTDKHR